LIWTVLSNFFRIDIKNFAFWILVKLIRNLRCKLHHSSALKFQDLFALERAQGVHINT